MRRSAVKTLVFMLPAALLVAAGIVLWGHARFSRPGPLAAERTLIIPKGAGLDTIARKLATEGVIDDPVLFKIGARLSGRGRAMRAGEYAFPAGVSMDGAVALLISGATVKRRLTVAEGLTTPQVLALVAAADGLEGQAGPPPGEGELLPETYFYSWGDSRAGLIARMREKMKATLKALWAARSDSLAISTPAQALVLSSIIEKETAVDGERARISAVFQNRLRRNMRLQSDPTVVFALTDGAGPLDRTLTHKDLEIDSPFNTYKVAGLPPSPIANPGRAAIEAALHPAATDDLYFVADGNGGHLFARTLAEHNRNVARLRRILRERRRQGGE